MRDMPEPLNALPYRSMPKEQVKAYLGSLEAYAIEQAEQGRSEKEIVAELRKAGHHPTTRFIVRPAIRKRLGVSERDLRIASVTRAVLAVVPFTLLMRQAWEMSPALFVGLLALCFAFSALIDVLFDIYWAARYRRNSTPEPNSGRGAGAS